MPEAARRLQLSEPTVRSQIEDPEGSLEGWAEPLRVNRRWRVWEDSLPKAEQRAARNPGARSPLRRGSRDIDRGPPGDRLDRQLEVLSSLVDRLAQQAAGRLTATASVGEGTPARFPVTPAEDTLEVALALLRTARAELATALEEQETSAESVRRALRRVDEALLPHRRERS